MSRYGIPTQYPRSKTTVLLVEPTLGFNSAQPETDIALGQTPYSRNMVMRDGALEPRSRLSQNGANSNPLGIAVTGGAEVISSVGTVYPLLSGTTRWAYYSFGSWSALSYVSSYGPSAPPSGTSLDYYQFVQIYSPVQDEMIAIGANRSYQTLLAWTSGSSLLSELTGAPRARFVATADNFVMAFNIRDVGSAQSKYVQRAQWSDRGNPSNWTGTLAGSEDLLTAKGEGTWITDLDNRVVLFFENEIWQGARGTFPSVWAFSRLDGSVGTFYGRTVSKTPIGLMFLGNDFMLYLLPKEGGAATPLGKAVQREFRTTIANPERAWAVYDDRLNAYRIVYPAIGGDGDPSREMVVNLTENNFAIQDYGPRSVTAGFSAFVQSASANITWANLTTAGYTWATLPYTWAQMFSSTTRVNRSIFMGSSAGTMFALDSAQSTDDGTPVNGVWRTGALGPDAPEAIKHVNQIRVDYAATVASALTVRVSRDQGVTFDPGQQVALQVATQETQTQAWVATPARYPTIELSTQDTGMRIYRLWCAMRQGGQ